MLKAVNGIESSLKVYAPAKINLHLEVLGLRVDGFHELAIVMQSIDLADQLKFSLRNDGEIVLGCDNPVLSTESDNLIVRAAKLLRKHVGINSLGATIHLNKRIPIGAGLAGGSSDAAATLIGLNFLWKLSLKNQELLGLSAELGSDIPFCLIGGTQLCFGRGEKLEPLGKAYDTMAILLVKDPKVTVSTPMAYRKCKEANIERYLRDEIAFERRRQNLRDAFNSRNVITKGWPVLRNDLQDVIEPITPSVQQALSLLKRSTGSLAVAMSGSGPSCFSLYEDLDAAKMAQKEQVNAFKEIGLDSWCCSFCSKGVRLEK